MEKKQPMTAEVAYDIIVSVCRTVKLNADESDTVMGCLRILKECVLARPTPKPVAKPKRKPKKKKKGK